MNILFNDFKEEIALRRDEYDQAINRVLSSGWFILGQEGLAFESAFASYIGTKEAIGVANGLEAIQIALMALGIGPGDEVITTPLSAVATTLAILAVGAKPIFVDVDEAGLIDISLIPAVITKKTKAVIPVHLFGNAVDLTQLKQLTEANHLWLIEDAAQAHGTTWQEKKVGSWGDINCFSFYPTKNVGAFGDAGAITTDNAELAQKCREIRDYGQQQKYIHTRLGLNSRLDELQAAILQVKLRYLDADNQQRRELAATYEALLQDQSKLQIIRPRPLAESNVHLFVIRSQDRDALKAALQEVGIPTLVHYPLVIPDQPFLIETFGQADVSVARQLTQEVLSLPCHPRMTKEDVKQICQQIKSLVNR